VGALTDRDFRFQVRVWYLDTTRSVCPGCARGCNIDVHVNRRRPHHAEGRRVARLKPRFNEDVNHWWMCDEGRYGAGFVDDPSRIAMPARREAAGVTDLAWSEAIGAVAGALGRFTPEQTAVIGSARMANEDLFALRTLAESRGIRQVGSRLPPRVAGYEDDILIRADKNPNTRGAELIGFGGDVAALLAAARSRRVRCLWVFEHDLFDSAWPEAEVREALDAVETLIFTGTNANPTSARAHLVLPAAAWVERDGTFTNFEGRVQRFRAALPPLGDALPAWDIVGRVLAALGTSATATRAEHWFRALAAAVRAFGGMTYQTVGDQGARLREMASA
jgi:NADH-quinone oxidoreductase subunit G